MSLSKIKAVTFDYFGTLVNVEKGASAGMRRVLTELGADDIDHVKTYLRWDELNVQRYRVGPYRKYRDVALEAMAACIAEFQSELVEDQKLKQLTEIFLRSLATDSPPQPEVPAALDELQARGLVLMPITNMDSDLWQKTALTSYFPKVTTAEMAQAYKPQERIFRTALDRLGLGTDEILHVAISPWADIEGAKPLGIRVAWINRIGESLGPWTPRPDYELPDLKGLPALFGDE